MGNLQGYWSLNHSCVPNCAMFTEDANFVKLVALRNIDFGEELCICYNWTSVFIFQDICDTNIYKRGASNVSELDVQTILLTSY